MIELCLAIPEDQFQRDGVNRWLIRRAMQGYLPDEVRLNTQRGLQAADLGQRVLENREEIEAAMAKWSDMISHAKSWIYRAWQMCWPPCSVSVTPQNTMECVMILTRGLMAGLFLLRF